MHRNCVKKKKYPHKKMDQAFWGPCLSHSSAESKWTCPLGNGTRGIYLSILGPRNGKKKSSYRVNFNFTKWECIYTKRSPCARDLIYCFQLNLNIAAGFNFVTELITHYRRQIQHNHAVQLCHWVKCWKNH